MGSYRTDSFWFGKYYLLNILVYSVLTAATIYSNHIFESTSYTWLLCLVPLFLGRLRYILLGSAIIAGAVLHQYSSEVPAWFLFWAPFAFYLGALSGVLLHNAAHGSFKPRWINPYVGELLAIQQLSAGFQVFRHIHNIHHANADHPVLDPHPPKGYKFLDFADASRVLITNALSYHYLKLWGDTEENRKKWKQQNILLLVSRFVKTLFIFSLIGPKYFALVYLPSYLGTLLFFACFNYFSHREQPDGSVEILNLDGNLAYRFANRILVGVMYHKNHHLKPKLFNPMHMKPIAEAPAREIKPKTEVA